MLSIRKRAKAIFGHSEPPAAASIVDAFHDLYYNRSAQTWEDTFWLGVPVLKCPLDLWIYQEIIRETRPDIIIETSTNRGGSALFMATICDALGQGRIVTIDIVEMEGRPEHPRIRYLVGSSVSDAVKAQIEEEVTNAGSVLVVLDSDHSEAHVRSELNAYGPLVSLGNYLIVEDTNVNGNPVFGVHGPGPMEAVRSFLSETNSFVPDLSREKYLLTFNPHGFLKRVSE